MMGSFLTRGIIMLLGYVYPAYECFKIVERKKPELEHLRFWCQYWIIIAVLTVLERVGDILVSWVPMYSEAKLAFIIYLWYPKTKGTTYVYATFLRPFVARHEPDIDRNLNELRIRAGDVALVWWQRGSVYAQARFYELLQYVASQSNRPQSTIAPPIRPQHPQIPPQAPPRESNQVPKRVPPQGGNEAHPSPPPPPPGHSRPGSGGAPVVDAPAGPGTAAGPALYPPAPTLRRAGSRARVIDEDEPEYDVIERLSDRSVPPNGEQDLPPPAYNTRNRLRNARN
ncbi:unnamed protein product [Sphagnum troendelagicum]|uniref:HVA22-like protein n=1 Tax=Sphagnum jensenii TaxID=128206 RepID=A0ABP0VQM0_9BRYO